MFHRTTIVIIIVSVVIAGILSAKLFFEQNGDLRVGVVNAYGDITWHASLITSFVDAPTRFVNPTFAGEKLVYPFLMDYISALLVMIGFSLPASVTLPTFFFLALTFVLIYMLGYRSTDRRTAGIITLLLFVCGGATFGFLQFTDIASSYTVDISGSGMNRNGYQFGSPLFTLLLPQRSLLLGMPLAIGIVLLLMNAKENWKRYAAAGILAALLPLAHTHSVVALVPVILGLVFVSKTKRWVLFFAVAGILGLPGVLYLLSGISHADSFFRYEPGWTAGDQNVLVFWFRNTGFLLLACVAAMFVKSMSKPAKLLVGSGLFIFLFSNVFLVAPWAWDNMKLLVYWLLFSLPAIGWIAAELWTRKVFVLRVVVSIFIFLHVISGSIEFWKVVRPQAPSWVVWNKEAIAFAQTIRSETHPDDVILAAPTFNSPVALAGRTRYLGYPGHVWSHGLPTQERERAVKDFYAENIQTLPDIQPDYVVFGPQEGAAEYQLFSLKEWLNER